MIFEDAGPAAGRALSYVHIDSWEAGGQNWTATFPAEFQARRGYDLRPWLPVLTGRVVVSAELSERFLWDVRTTVSEMIRDNYAGRLRELARTHGIKLSIEAYGHLCIDNLAYAGVSDMPISEFWARGEGLLPSPGGYEASTKVMASAAHTYGKPVVAAEAFTSDRGWRDHPFLLKSMGDRKFCEGLNLWINRMIGNEQLPLDGDWKDFETLPEWPDWFMTGKPRPSGRYTFSSCRHYPKDSPLVSSGLLGPVTIRAAGFPRPEKRLPPEPRCTATPAGFSAKSREQSHGLRR